MSGEARTVCISPVSPGVSEFSDEPAPTPVVLSPADTAQLALATELRNDVLAQLKKDVAQLPLTPAQSSDAHRDLVQRLEATVHRARHLNAHVNADIDATLQSVSELVAVYASSTPVDVAQFNLDTRRVSGAVFRAQAQLLSKIKAIKAGRSN